jgi:hypothetical protein
MENFERYIIQLREECSAEKKKLGLELTQLVSNPKPATQDIVGKSEIEKLEDQDKLLNGMVNGITSISSEILVSIRLLKQKKQNINDLLNQLTSMVQAKALITEVDKYSSQTAIESLKKFVIELHYSLENVPQKYFQPEIQVYKAFKQRLEGILREKMDDCLLRKNMGELNTVTTLLNVLKIQYDVGMKYENVFKQTTELKVDEVKKVLDKKISSFVSLKNCLNSNSYNLKDDIDSQSNYPFIFFEALVDALTIFYETMTGFKDSSFITEDSRQLRRMLALLFDEMLSDLLKALRKKMDSFYEFDYLAFGSSKPDLSIMIERENKGTAKFTKQIDEIVVLEYYLTELMNISSQVRLFTQEATLEVKILIESCGRQSNPDPHTPLVSDVRRIVQSFTFNEEVMGLMTVYNQVQERVLKMRLAIVMSTSSTLRALFYNDLAAIREYKKKSAVEEKPGVVTKVKESANSADFLDELYYCLKTASFRAIKSLDKITACSIMAFIFNVILGNHFFTQNLTSSNSTDSCTSASRRPAPTTRPRSSSAAATTTPTRPPSSSSTTHRKCSITTQSFLLPPPSSPRPTSSRSRSSSKSSRSARPLPTCLRRPLCSSRNSTKPG